MPNIFLTSPQYRRRPRKSALRQRGLSMAVVLVSLIVMGLAAVSLTRMIDTGTLIIGNIAFKQSTTASTDRGMELANAYLNQTMQNSPANLFADRPQEGYYASVRPQLDATWSGNGNNRVLPGWNDVNCTGAAGNVAECLWTTGDANMQNDGSQVRYLIIRLCNAAGDHTQWATRCVRPLADMAGYERPSGALDYANVWNSPGAAPAPVFRIIVRATGPKNTVSYTDTYVQF